MNGIHEVMIPIPITYYKKGIRNNYYVTNTGDIYDVSLDGVKHKLKIYSDSKKRPYVYMKNMTNTNTVRYRLAPLVWNVFNGYNSDVSRSFKYNYRDNNPMNCTLSNIIVKM
jgi:hypothetical protein